MGADSLLGNSYMMAGMDISLDMSEPSRPDMNQKDCRMDQTNEAPEEEVVHLRSEVKRLKAMIEKLGASAAPVPTATVRIGITHAANAARLARSAAIDARIVEVMKECLVEVAGRIHYDGSNLGEFFGFPHFYSYRRFHMRIADRLNQLGVPAPRGGTWSARQVYRGLLRHAARAAQ